MCIKIEMTESLLDRHGDAAALERRLHATEIPPALGLQLGFLFTWNLPHRIYHRMLFSDDYRINVTGHGLLWRARARG